MTRPILTLDKVTKRFQGLKAVGGDDGLSFTVREGGFLGLIGPNGAGKSTTFNLISGVLKPTSGRALLDGEDLSQLRASDIASRRLGRTFQTPRAFASLDVLSNVMIGADHPEDGMLAALTRRFRGADRGIAERAEAVLARVGLADRRYDEVGNLSGGELRMLEVARQLVREPRILLLDEPTAGVDPTLQTRLAALLRDLHAQGTTLVVVEHNLHFLLGLADAVVVLQNGRLLAEGSPAEIRSNAGVIAAYLGAEHAA